MLGSNPHVMRSIGFSLFQDAIRRAIAVTAHAGIRALLTPPLDTEAEALYRRFGFEPTPENELQLILLHKDARRIAGTSRCWSVTNKRMVERSSLFIAANLGATNQIDKSYKDHRHVVSTHVLLMKARHRY